MADDEWNSPSEIGKSLQGLVVLSREIRFRGMMKIAVLSDIHGNWPAAQAVAADIEAWRPDVVVVNGDTVNRGPKSPECWDFIQRKRQAAGWLATLGNHEEYVWQYTRPDADDGFPMSYWTYQQMNGRVQAIGGLPEMLRFTAPDGGEVRVCHASMKGNQIGIFTWTTDEEARGLIAPPPAVFVTAHTHRPTIRPVDETMIVNVGSVGQPCDGDIRASYGRLAWRDGRWAAEIARVAYDREETERDFQASGFLTEAGAVAHLIYHEWRLGRPVLHPYLVQYEDVVKAGVVDEATAVTRFLDQIGFGRNHS